MATTTNYGWETPDNTDLVRDGAEAIRDLGEAIDNTVYLNSELVGSGLVHIATASPSTVSSQSFNNVFSATFQNYVIKAALTYTNSIDATFRYRVVGSDDSTSNYSTQSLRANVTTVSAGRGTGGTSANFFTCVANQSFYTNIDLSNPFAAARTTFTSLSADQAPIIDIRGNQHQANTSFDGITFLASAGTFTGTIRIYGVQN